MRCLGLMSGTSADGVDAVLAEFNGRVRRPNWSLLHHQHTPYPCELKRRIVAAGQGTPLSGENWLDLAEAITEVQAAAARACDPASSAELVGCHGQTVWHRPPQELRRGASWQVLQAPLLARLLNRPVVHDFRAADLCVWRTGRTPGAESGCCTSGGNRRLARLAEPGRDRQHHADTAASRA